MVGEEAGENIIFDEFEEEIMEEDKSFIDIASDYNSQVIEEITKAGYIRYFIEFFQRVKQQKYPLTNIAFLLWLETVRWFSCTTSLSMWYWNKTKTFWRAGYRLFHGKFLTIWLIVFGINVSPAARTTQRWRLSLISPKPEEAWDLTNDPCFTIPVA